MKIDFYIKKSLSKRENQVIVKIKGIQEAEYEGKEKGNRDCQPANFKSKML